MNIKKVSELYGISTDTLRYYERVGAIPPVTRTSAGVRDFSKEDLAWVEMAKCMRSAGLPIEVLVEYLRLYQAGDETIKDRLDLLVEQKEVLVQQKKNIEEMLDRLNYKIERYEKAVETGKLIWNKEGE